VVDEIINCLCENRRKFRYDENPHSIRRDWIVVLLQDRTISITDPYYGCELKLPLLLAMNSHFSLVHWYRARVCRRCCACYGLSHLDLKDDFYACACATHCEPLDGKMDHLFPLKQPTPPHTALRRCVSVNDVASGVTDMLRFSRCEFGYNPEHEWYNNDWAVYQSARDALTIMDPIYVVNIWLPLLLWIHALISSPGTASASLHAASHVVFSLTATCKTKFTLVPVATSALNLMDTSFQGYFACLNAHATVKMVRQ
jgi:hypothetical protein